MIRILVADDHAIVRRGLGQIVADESDMQVMGEAQTTQEILDLARQEEWDVIVLNISMPGRGGFEALKALKQTHSKRPVLVLSMYPEDQFAVRAFRAGAAGYILKKAAGTELVSAIRAVHSGESFLHPAVAKAVVDRYVAEQAREGPESLYEQLSDREKEVLKLLAEGRSNREIAELLSLSAKTVMAHRANIMEKLDVHNRTDLVKFAIRVGLVDVRA